MRTVLAVLTVGLLTLIVAPLAAAEGPTIEKYEESGTWQNDPSICGFQVTVEATAKVVVLIFPANSSSPYAVVAHVNGTLVLSANGKTFTQTWSETLTESDELVARHGLQFKVTIPDGGLTHLRAGTVVYGVEGEDRDVILVFEAGRADAFDTPAFCALLAP
jgi:hypothetical protein